MVYTEARTFKPRTRYATQPCVTFASDKFDSQQHGVWKDKCIKDIPYGLLSALLTTFFIMLLLFSILWVTAYLFMLAVANSSEQNIARGLNDIMQELDPLTHFQSTPKNIMFGANMGGSSHHSWVMRVLDELDRRGHKITYATTASIRKVRWH